MQEWFRVTLLLCAFGLLREIRPSEPYVTEFLTDKQWRNISEETVNKEVYPVGTYSYLSLLFVVFLITDLLRYKPVIITSGICGILIYTILLWTESLVWLQVTQLLYGLYIATEVAYYTYMFTKADRDKYAAVSSWTRTAALSGRLISGVAAQILTSLQLMNYRELNYITLSTQIMATLWALLLPPVRSSVYFHNEQNNINANLNASNQERKKISLMSVLLKTFHEARISYSKPTLTAWSLFYAATACCFIQVQNYVQLLWKNIDPDAQSAYNGLVEACLTGLGALGAAAAGKWTKVRGAYIAAPLSFIQGGLIILAVLYPNLIVAYVCYVLVGVFHHYLLTLASYRIANELCDESFFGLIFGINTFVSTAMQSLLTFIVISDTVLGLNINGQFLVWAGSYIFISVVWLVVFISGLNVSEKSTS